MAGWRFLADAHGPANVFLELNVKLKEKELNALGGNFEKTKNGFVDFLLLNAKGFPQLVLEAKAEDKNPLVGKEQARKYARSQNCRFVIFSNGNLHYFWDLDRGNPYVITTFPRPQSVAGYQKVIPDLVRHIIETKQFTDLATNPVFSTGDLKAVPPKYRYIVPEYVKGYVSLNQFAP